MTKRVEDLQPGDEVVIHTGNAHQPYTIGKVEKVTATQLTVNGERYSKDSLTSIGGPKWRDKKRLARALGQDLMTVEDANRKNQEVATEWEISGLVHKIKDAHSNKLKKLPIDMLRQIVELLEQAN